MRRILRALLPGLLVIAAAPAARAALLHRPATPAPLRIAAGHASEVVLIADPATLDADARGALRVHDVRLASVLAAHGLGRVRAGAGGVLVLTSDRADFDPWAAAAALRASGAVVAAAPNVALHLDDTIPNDPFLSEQWWVPTAAAGGIHLPQAWDVERGAATVRIGIMDTGVDLGHPDLATQIWTNPGEIAGNGIDDDGNGYIDDLHGWDFGNNDADPNPHAIIDPSADVDIGFHGTFVAALAAAATNNAEGIAGTAWNCRIVPLKVADSTGDIPLSAVGQAFAYATAKHLEVLNMSLGAPDSGGVLAAFFQPLVNAANAAGVVCVAAAGNDGADTPSYPAACIGVVGVGATNDSNTRSSFSNYGGWVSVGAPGELMWSAICRNYTIDDYSQIFYLFFFGWDGDHPYMEGDGTSFASPIVAGICGLVRSRYPALTPAQVRHQVMATGDVVAYDEHIGPRVNAYKAVTLSPVAVDRWVDGAAVTLALSPNPMRRDCALQFTLPRAGGAMLRIYDTAGRNVRTLASGTLGAGAHTLRWDGNDDAGRHAPPGVYTVHLEHAGGSVTRRLVRIQ